MFERVTGATWLGVAARARSVDPQEFWARREDRLASPPMGRVSPGFPPPPARPPAGTVVTAGAWSRLRAMMSKRYRPSARAKRFVPGIYSMQMRNRRSVSNAEFIADAERAGATIGALIQCALIFWVFIMFYDALHGIADGLHMIAAAFR